MADTQLPPVSSVPLHPEEWDQEEEEGPMMPFPAGKLPSEHEKQITTIRQTFLAWLSATDDFNQMIAGSRERMNRAMKELSELKVEKPFNFEPAPPYVFRSVLLSCTKCYWMALVASLDAEQQTEMGHRLDCIPPYDNRIPKFNGERCVKEAGSLSSFEYQGLMRSVAYAVIGLTSREVTVMWRELGEVGVQTWEERD